MLLGLIAGNSTVRYGVLDEGRVLRSGAVAWDRLAAGVGDMLRVARNSGVEGVVAGSVRDDHLRTLERSLAPEYTAVSVAGRDFPLPIENRYTHPDEVGTDRLLACIAARERCGGRGAIVVDFGTALTVNVVSPAGAFLGGTIAAGARTIHQGLEAATPDLPRVDVAKVPGTLPARDTASAIATGVFWEVAGGVREIVGRLSRDLGFHPRVYATGGEAERFRSSIPEVEAVFPDLVLEGLALACLRKNPGAGG